MGEIAYLEFYDGYVQQPCLQSFEINQCLGGRKTKGEIARAYQTDLNVIRRITDYHFPLVWSTKQARKKCYSGKFISIKADDGYYQWFLQLCLQRFFRFSGTTKVNHEYLVEWIDNCKILFSWEMFMRDVLGYSLGQVDVLNQIGEIRYSTEQIEANYQTLRGIRRNETSRFIATNQTNRESIKIVPKSNWWDRY